MRFRLTPPLIEGSFIDAMAVHAHEAVQIQRDKVRRPSLTSAHSEGMKDLLACKLVVVGGPRCGKVSIGVECLVDDELTSIIC
jgi:hypothetical protein